MADHHNVADSLLPLLVPLTELYELPGNPHKGDDESVKRSYARFKQLKPIVTALDEDGRRVVYGGNTQLRAARLLGWTHMAAVDASHLSRAELEAFAVADNRTAQLGTDDEDLLAEMLWRVAQEDITLVEDAGYSEKEFEKLLKEEPLPEPGDAEIEDLSMAFGVIVDLEDEQEQVEMLSRLAAEGYQVRAVMS